MAMTQALLPNVSGASASPAAAPASMPPPGDPSALFIVDISSYIFRAYHALPPLSTSGGEPVHAVKGVADMLLRLIKEQQPARLAIAVDAPGPTFRSELYPEYKATRKETPPDLRQQIERVHDMIAAWGIASLECPGFEADDVIASAVRRGREREYTVIIVSADKDLLQLIEPGVLMYDSMRERVYGEAETIERMGVPPGQVRDLLALMGDSSDNIPGVPSVGKKTAVQLLSQFGDMDGVYAQVEEISRKALKAKLIEHRAQAFLSRDLVSLKTDLEFEFAEERLRINATSPPDLRKLFAELEFTRALAQLEPAPAVEGHYGLATDPEAVLATLAAAHESSELAIFSVLDGDHASRAPMLGVALCPTEGTACYLPQVADRPELLELLRPTLENSLFPKFGDAKREIAAFAELGITLRGLRFDPTIASYLLDPGRHAHDIADVSRAELDAELSTVATLLGKGRDKKKSLAEVPVAELGQFAAERADYVLRLSHVLRDRMTAPAFRELSEQLELPLAEVLALMERTGVRIDADLLRSMSEQAAQELSALEAKCTELAGQAFNVASPRQLETILFDVLKLPVIKKTKTARSTDQQVLEDLTEHHPLPAAILEHRQLAKLKSTYLDALPRQVHEQTGRIHTLFNQVVAATGRLSSSDPNLQNIPIRTELGRRVRDAFVPEPGFEMMSADYSQIELRVLAHLSQDQELITAYRDDLDVHVRTATALFEMEEHEVDRAMRGQAKTVNFAVIYGQTQFALARNLGIERREAKRYIDAFFARYAGVKQFMDEVVERAREQGYVETMLGRRRALPDIRSRNPHLRAGAERIARNTPIQGTAADIMKRAMVHVARELKRRRARSRMVLTVHDELVFELLPEEKESLASKIKELMEHALELSVPLVVDMGFGPNWGAAH